MSNLIGPDYHLPCPKCGKEMGNAAGLGECGVCSLGEDELDDHFKTIRKSLKALMDYFGRDLAAGGEVEVYDDLRCMDDELCTMWIKWTGEDEQ